MCLSLYETIGACRAACTSRCYDRHHIDAYIRHHMRRAGGNDGANPPATLRSPATNVSMGTRLTPVSQNTINTIQFLVDNGAVGDDETAQRWNEAATLRKLTQKFANGMESERDIYNLANFYRNGLHGLPIDNMLAHEWLMKAAEKEDRLAVGHVGWNLVHGVGVEKDERRGVEMIKFSADMGLSQASYFLGMWHSTGAHGLPRCRDLSIGYLSAAIPKLAKSESADLKAKAAKARSKLQLFKHQICPMAEAFATVKIMENPEVFARIVEAMATKGAEVITARVVKRLSAEKVNFGFCRMCAGPVTG